MPKISFCVITEGDIKLNSLKRLVQSVEGHVSSVHITANGGEEDYPCVETKEWCKEKGYDYSYLKWDDDFSQQRNFNFSRVPVDTDYILWADTDDVIIGAQYLPKIASDMLKHEIGAVYFTYWYGCLFNGEPSEETLEQVEVVQMRERLLRPGMYEWKKGLHETPVKLPGVQDKYAKVAYNEKDNPIVWLHLGASRDISQEAIDKRTKRNRRILEKDLRKERETGGADPRTLLYLMKIYTDSDDKKDWIECINMGEEYLTKSGWDRERCVSLQLMSRCYGKLGNHQKSIEALHVGIKEYPYDPLTYLYLARAYFNIKDYRNMKHWLTTGLNLNMDDLENGIVNILELKLIAAELTMYWHLHAEKNARKAFKASQTMYELEPNEQNLKNVETLQDLAELEEASENTHKLIKYLESIGRESDISGLIDSLPSEIKNLPFAVSYYNKYVEPRKWEDNEVCYYASFGQPHFEKWGPNALKTGIGGSETAVIRLAQEWTEMGYKVTVFGDPGIEEGTHDGVTYLPYTKFNPKDHFNIFIQWRASFMAQKIVCKKFLVDLHDIFHETDHLGKLDGIDRIMVKSKYHRNLAPKIPDVKFNIISNGI